MKDQPDFPLEVLRRQFPIVDDAVYLDHAAVGPISRGVQEAMYRQSDTHATRVNTAQQIYTPVYLQCREAAARLVGSRPERIAFTQTPLTAYLFLRAGRTGGQVIM